jgi:hypothetical protein
VREVRVVGVGERLGLAGLTPEDAHALDLVVAAEVTSERSDH